MSVLRTAAILLVCLGLAFPSGHGIALCVRGDGLIAVGISAGGRCVGSQAPGGSPSDHARGEERCDLSSADRDECCVGTVLERDGLADSATVLSEKHNVKRMGNDSRHSADESLDSERLAVSRTPASVFERSRARSSSLTTVILRL